MYEAQLKLRGLSYEVAQEGEGGPHPQDGVGLDLEEPRPQSSQTACLEYNEPQEWVNFDPSLNIQIVILSLSLSTIQG